MTTPYDSTADTLRHSLRVAELMGQPVKELMDRSVHHDLSKTREPERATYDQYVPRLRAAVYGSEEHAELVEAMGEGLRHHHAHNRHHPEHFPRGVHDMTLVDLIEMLADWKAATERTEHADQSGEGDQDERGDLAHTLELNCERFGIAPQLMEILANTARHHGWLGAPPDQES
ncbi:hypothetical protein Caci_5076 [Catenulispora acidiphila DSM 44928]|uniref:Uncharacterized protein n=1 Tax=Catenulispora acidiphila (strain DSM 44928 / JCM 14897 / NBRC 102108 / NRRL B-24433 / ID139908) TaxID=479433 RepID=C7Q4Y8_CATAD|nr:DUF5662 family protein [Catenulispora acidiphila]ACU73936.1 hypothetical protein Caci_5076 [Catenulispora acidiphila DSM 44928]